MAQSSDDEIGNVSEMSLKIPPNSIEAEQSLLGGIMLDNTAWDKIADIVIDSDFYRKDHQIIFSGVKALIENSEPCDVVTLSEYLDNQGQLDAAGGLEYIATLANETPSAANAFSYAKILRERSVLRSLISAGNQISGNAYLNDGRTTSELVDDAERLVFEIAEKGNRGKSGFQSIKNVLPATIDRIEYLHNSDGDLSGISTGFKEFDKLTTGLQAGD